jgi:hypothetical protein
MNVFRSNFTVLFGLLALGPVGLCQGTYRRPAPVLQDGRVGVVQAQPSDFVTFGGGDQAPGHGAAFAYGSVSHYLGQQSWATAVSEYSMFRGQVISCPMGGVSHVVAGFGAASFGVVGAVGACSGTPSGASTAESAQGFGVVHVWRSLSFVATARKTFVNTTCAGSDVVCQDLKRPAVRFTIGIGFQL